MTGKQRMFVLLDDPGGLAETLPVVARVVAQTLDEHLTDHIQRVRYGGGIVARDVSEAQAREIARGLASVSLGSFLVDAAEWTAPPRPRRVSRFDLAEGGLIVAPKLKPPQTLQWGDVLAIHAHGLVEAPTEDGTDLPARRGGDMTLLSPRARKVLGDAWELEERDRVRVSLGIDLLLAGPVLYRIASDDTGIYGSLPARSPTALENYLALLDLIIARAPRAVLIPRSTRRFVGQGQLGPILFGKREELESWNGWIIHALAAGVVQGSEPEEVGDEALEDGEEEAVLLGSDAGVVDADDVSDDELDDDEPADEPAPDEPAPGPSFQEEPTRAESRAPRATTPPAPPAARDDGADDDVVDDADLAEAEAAAETQGAGGVDDEVRAAGELFDPTGRFRASDVRAMLEDAKAIDVGEDGPAEAQDPEVKQTADFFDASSGRWDVRGVLAGDDVDRTELEAAEAVDDKPPAE